MDIWGQLLLQFILIFLNAVFACAEIAVLSVNEAKITKLEENGSRSAKKLRKLTEQPSKFLSTIQIAITLSGFLGSAFAADNFAARLVDWAVKFELPVDRDVLQNIAVVIITLILSYFTLILGELVPKRLAMKKSESMALAMAPMLLGFAKLFTPVVWFLSVSTNLVLRMMGIDPNEEDEEVSEEGIRLMVDEGGQKGVIDEQEQKIIQNVFEFNDITVGEFATHRTDIHPLWLEDDDEEWENIIHDTRHSMYPVCGDSIDNVVGILSVKDYFRLRGAPRQQILDEALRPAYYVPEGLHADVLMKQMKNTKNHFAVVLDEYGGLRGIVTMNDLLEQLVGDLTDNNDEAEPEEPDIVKLDTPEDDDCEGIWVIRGVASLSEVAEELNVELPTEKYDTMGGYVFSNYGIVPEDGTEFDIELEPLHVRVTEIKDHRIMKMIVRRDRIVIDGEEDDEDDDDEKETEKDSGEKNKKR